MPQSRQQRAIDAINSKRKVPMRLLALGMSRTGSISLWTALKELGYTPYHSADLIIENSDRDTPLWTEALVAKFEGRGRPYGRHEFDKLLSTYDSVIDVPCILFVPELLAAYPDAKVIIQRRPVDSWYKSFKATVVIILEWRFYGLNILLRKIEGHLFPGCDIRNEQQMKAAYLKYYETVEKLCTEQQRTWMRMDLGEGWERICQFLEKDVPNHDYPRLYDSQTFLETHERWWWDGILKTFQKTVGGLVLTLAVVIGVYIFLRRQ